MSMQWLLDSLELEAFPRSIIHATSIKQVSDLYNYLCTENPSNIHKVDMFHSETADEKKSDIIKKLQDGDSDLKLLIASNICSWNWHRYCKLSCSNFIWFTIYNNRLDPGSWQNWQ